MPRINNQEQVEIVKIDRNVSALFPKGAKIVEASHHGSSRWASSVRVELQLKDGSAIKYFLKLAAGEVGKGMLKGEHKGMEALYKYIPEGVPRPVDSGTCESDPNMHFYLCEFVNMTKSRPDKKDFCKLLAKLHIESKKCTRGKFGFETPTYEGTMQQDTRWCDTWEESFTLHFKAFADQESKAHHRKAVLEGLLEPMCERVIPRLLRPLVSHGRTLEPVLVHGDIWLGNIDMNADTQKPVMFDASAFWGHNEYDLNNMNLERYGLKPDWVPEYHNEFAISAPADDFEDRIKLYEIRANLCASTLYNDLEFGQLAISESQRLIAKYPRGYQGE